MLAAFTQALLSAQTAGGRKAALVMGNASYSSVTKLRNPGNDARDMGAALKALGFDTEVLVDGSYGAMMEAAERFAKRLSGAEVGFFFYAGHGVASAGVNYLLPTDAAIEAEYQLRFKALSADYVMEAMNASGCQLNIVVLDACRDNPFATVRSLGRGLVITGTAPKGAIIAYATDPGKTAADGEGRNGVFTSALLNNIKTPGLDVKEMFDRAGAEVAAFTEGAQTPWLNSKFYGKYYLAGSAAAATSPGQVQTQAAPANSARKFEVLEHRYTAFGGPIPEWIRAWELGGEREIEGLESFKAKRVFMSASSGRDLDALKLKAQGLDIPAELPLLVNARVKARFPATSSMNAEFLRYFSWASEGCAFEGSRLYDFWMKKLYTGGGVPAEEVYEYFVLITADRKSLDGQLDAILKGRVPGRLPTIPQSAILDRVKDAFFGVF